MNTKKPDTLYCPNKEENYYDELLQILNHPAMILNANGNVISCNEAFIELYALSYAELINCNFFDVCITKNLTPPFRELNNNQSQSTISIKNTLDKSTKTMQWTTLKITKGKYKNSIFIEGFDITTFLTDSAQEKYVKKSIIDLIPNHYIFWKDKNSAFLGCNEAFASLIGLKSCSDIIGKTDYDLFISKEQSDAYRADDKLIMETGTPKLNIEEYQTLSDGNTRVLSTSKMPLFDNQGQIYGILAIYSDITERKNLEICLEQSKNLAEAANIAKTEFLANMRHDIRTPLSGIVGFSEIIKSESKEPRIKAFADNLVASSHALLHLMDEVLDAIKVSSGEIPKLKKKFDLVKTLEEVVALYCAKAQAKRLKLLFNIDKKLPRFVLGDKTRLHRIALELVGNALNFTDVGQVTLGVELAKRENRNLVIKITVTDTGMGIPKEKQEEIYVQFKRLTPSYQGVYKGSGLGLYVVKQFIDELEAEIYVDSEPHYGTCFTCLIPLQESLLDDASGLETAEELKTEKPYMAAAPHQLILTPSDTKIASITSHILVVEDNLVAQAVACTLLAGMSCQVDIAANGNEAIALYEKNHYDLILMDIGLGEGMDGYEVTHHIRNQHNETNHTPIIALTAHAGDDNQQRCIEAGMDAVLTKPLTQAHAANILNTFIPARCKLSKDITAIRGDLPDREEELFQLEQFSLLDIDQALKNCGINHTMLVEMLTLMVTQELPTDLERMKKAFESQDYPLVEKIAHKIKGGAIYLGTTRMKYACQYVERYRKTGKSELFEQLYHQAVKTIEDSSIYITDWLERDRGDSNAHCH